MFIDSPGGSTYFAEGIFRTLKLPNQDSGERRRLITVGLNLAASAACNLLIAGDYSLVHPHTTVLCHGVRQSGDGLNVTRESALDLAKNLASSNEQYALQLATNAISRFIFRFATLRPLFQQVREEQSEPTRTDVFCFLDTLSDHVSESLNLLLQLALGDTLRNDNIDMRIRLKLLQEDNPSRKPVEFEALILKCMIDHDVEFPGSKPSWSFREVGIAEFEGRFAVLLSSHDKAHNEQIQKLLSRWGEFLLTNDQQKTYAELDEDKKEAWLSAEITPLLRSLWFLFVAIARRLQQNENYLNAEEAYWLGLVDEIIGRLDLPSPRMIVEFSESVHPQNTQP